MSLVQPGEGDSRPSGLTLNLSSNNPFRNRIASPHSPSYTPSAPPPRPVSRNPFLDPFSSNTPQSPFSTSPDKMTFPSDVTSPPAPALSGNAAILFDNLTLNDRPSSSSNGMRPQPARANTGDKPPPPAVRSRGENVPPRPHPDHRPSRSQEDARRAHRAANPTSGAGAGSSSRSRPAAVLDIFADPVEESSPKKSGRPRRNSESSVVDRSSSKLLDPEEEKKRQERRRRERERRHREKGKDSKSRRPDRKLDIIDKLDVTSIYGTGLFHHDGPFDACNPHRNRNGSRRAPMQAFPKDSLNNALGGGGPINRRPDHAAFLGNYDDEAFKDYSNGASGVDPYDTRAKSSKTEANVQSATTRIEPIHGEETLGLGTSTFLEGAPASRTAMQRRESETGQTEGGLSRTKSLAQKIRGINTTRRDYGQAGRVTSPDGNYGASSYSPAVRSQGGSNTNHFNEFTSGDDSKKDVSVTFAETRTGRARAPSSPGRGFGERLERRVTSGSSETEQPKSSGGFLSRVKSLKGGPRKHKDSGRFQDSDYY